MATQAISDSYIPESKHVRAEVQRTVERQHLTALIWTEFLAMSVGCLFLCHYLALPRQNKCLGLNGAIRRALGQTHVAPEILLTLFGGHLDPKLR